MNNMENKNNKDKQPDNIFRRLPENFKLPDNLSEEQKDKKEHSHNYNRSARKNWKILFKRLSK